MFKIGDEVEYVGHNLDWHGARGRVTATRNGGETTILTATRMTPHISRFFTMGCSWNINTSELTLISRGGGFGKWFREHSHVN